MLKLILKQSTIIHFLLSKFVTMLADIKPLLMNRLTEEICEMWYTESALYTPKYVTLIARSYTVSWNRTLSNKHKEIVDGRDV